MRNRAYEKWKQKLMLSAKKANVPAVCHFELTPRCNLDCKMCYIHTADSNSWKDRELSTDTWKRIFDEAYDCGMLFANLSGGECMLRQDFQELYLHLWRKRVMIAVLTNGTLITDEYLEFFKKYPPAEVQVSLYGSNEEGYLKVTGHRGFQKAADAIQALTELGIPVHVAVTPSAYMKDDFINIRRFCKDNQIWCNPSEFNLAKKRDNSQKEDCDLTIDEMVELAKQQALLSGPLTPLTGTLPPCGGDCTQAPQGTTCNAGKGAALICWDGMMHPCTMLPVGTASLLEMPFAQAWEITKKVTQQILLGAECVGCPYDKLCPKCPAKRLTGLYTGHCDPLVCEMTRRLVAEGVAKLPEEK